MSFLSFLTGNSKSVDKVIDAGINGMDKLVFTDEEKADYNRALQKLSLKFVELTANESTAQSISRRMICLPVVYSWLACIFMNIAAGFFDKEIAALTQAVTVLETPAFVAIGFYCARHIAASIKGK